MTFSLLGRCARTGRIGAAVATSSIAVGSRVPFVAPGIGGVLTQHRTDPRLGPRGVALLRSGCTAAETVAALAASTPQRDWRQIAALDASGDSAHFHGARVKPELGAAPGRDCVSIGNILADAGVPAAMTAGFEAASGEELAERLLRALEAGEAAGGEHGDVRSAALLVVGVESFPLVDLRADWAPLAVSALRVLWEEYRPKVDEFVVRALDPDSAPDPA